MKYRVIDSKRVFEGPSLKIRRDTFKLESALCDVDEKSLHGPGAAKTFSTDVVEHPGAVVIVPCLPDGRIVMIRQYRHALGRSIIEFPAGTLEPEESPEVCADRELMEEAGYKAGELIALGTLVPAPGFCDEVLHVFFANKIFPHQVSGDEDEIIEVLLYRPEDLWSEISDGSILDAKTIAALSRAVLRGYLPFGVM